MSRPVFLTGTSFVLVAALLAVAACSAHEPKGMESATDESVVEDGRIGGELGENEGRADANQQAAGKDERAAGEKTRESRDTDQTGRRSASTAAASDSAPAAEPIESLEETVLMPISPMMQRGASPAREQLDTVVTSTRLESKKSQTVRKRLDVPADDAESDDLDGASIGDISAATGSESTVGGSLAMGGAGRMAPAGTTAPATATPRPNTGPTSSVAHKPAEIPAQPITMYGNTEDYVDYGVNPFTMVGEDALSTFSIDVDTASYSITRKKIEAGVLPPPEAVRVEEFVNYLDYGYAAPTDGSPFAVHMAAMPDPLRDGRHILRVGVQAKEVSRDEREPVHLTFLVDVSGSMSSADKLGLAKTSMHMLVDSLREDDTVALATYAGRTARVLEPTSAGNKAAIHSAIENLKSGGSTAMSSGIDMAYEMAWESFQKGHENRVIVLSDGDANVGKTSWDDMLSQIKGYADRGVTVSTIGFGMGNYQDTLMEQLSNKGDGNNYYIDDAVQAQRVFVEELGGTLVTVARDVKIQVEFNPRSVTAYRLIGYENRDVADKDFRNDKVDAGEIGSGHNVTALYEVIMAEGYDRSLATVRLRYELPGADVDQGGSGGIEKAFTFRDRDLSERADFASRELRIAYSSATFAEVLRHSPEVSEISLDALIAFAQKAQRPGEKDDTELVGLMKKARALGAGTSGGTVSAR